jgi:hypothetical protein
MAEPASATHAEEMAEPPAGPAAPGAGPAAAGASPTARPAGPIIDAVAELAGPPRPPRRRAAAPSRGTAISSGEDVPSIGGLIFALHQKPSRKPFLVAAIGTGVWALLSLLMAWAMLGPELRQVEGFGDLLTRPAAVTVLATTLIPIALFWFLALLVWRAQELRLMSSAMTEVAVRLAEPDRMAEQSIASLGQSVRRQVAYMNDAIGRAIGRASELEALVHSEVSALERSYSENEYRIRNLIQELASERAALANNSERVSEALHGIGAKVSQEIVAASRQATESLSEASRNLAQIIDTRSGSIAAAATAAGTVLDEKLSERGHSLLSSLSVMTQRIGTEVPVIIERMGQEQVRLTKIIEAAGGNLSALEQALTQRTSQLDTTLEGTTRALDHRFAQHAQAVDQHFAAGMRSLDEAIVRSAAVMDQSVSQRTLALAGAMEQHARSLGEALSRKSADLDQTLLRGVDAVRRSSDNITRQSIKTIEGLASQAALLKDVSENLLGQINTLTGRFENQGKSIMKAAHALETSNLKVDSVLQARHSELADLLERMSDRARSFDSAVQGYSSSLDSSIGEAERRAREAAQGLARSTETRSREAVAELERFRTSTEAEAERTMAELRGRLAAISGEVTAQLSDVSSRFNVTTGEVRERALRAADELESMQSRLRDQMQNLPETSRESAETVRRALQDQLRALEQLTVLANRQGARHDIAPPDRANLSTLSQVYGQQGRGEPPRGADSSFTSAMAREMDRLGIEPQPPRAPAGALPPPAPQPGAPAPAGQRERTGWSLGDLLDRASRDELGEDAAVRAAGQARAAAAQYSAASPVASINIGNIAQALDPVTAADLWTRFRSGQRGILSRGVYTLEGQATFDEITRRYHLDIGFRGTVNRYLGDFERLLTDAEAREPGGRIAENYLISETGRVYLLLAHASGRLA